MAAAKKPPVSPPLPGSGPAILYNLLEETKAVVKYLHRILIFQKIRLILAWKDIPSKLNTSYLWPYSFAFFALHILNLQQILLI